MKKLAAALLAATAAAGLVPAAMAPAAQADVCANAGGRHVSVGGCTNVKGDVAIASAATPYVPGEVPCYTAEGVPYYTPPGDPC